MFSHQGVKIFEKIRSIVRCGLVVEVCHLGVGVKVSKAHARPNLCLLVD